MRVTKEAEETGESDRRPGRRPTTQEKQKGEQAGLAVIARVTLKELTFSQAVAVTGESHKGVTMESTVSLHLLAMSREQKRKV